MSIASSISVSSITTTTSDSDSRSSVHPFDVKDDTATTTTTTPGDVLLVDNHEAQHKGGESLESLEGFEEKDD